MPARVEHAAIPAKAASGPGAPEPGTSAVIVTRPAGQSDYLLAALQAAGFATLAFPLIDIRPVSGADSAALDGALRTLSCFDLVFFVSPNAIARAFAHAEVLGIDIAGTLATQQTRVAAVGPGSVRALIQAGLHPDTHRLLAPANAVALGMLPADQADDDSPGAAAVRYDSEALLQALRADAGDLSCFAGRRVLIVRGDGGRELFADALRDAGADVMAVCAYHRDVPQPDAMQWQKVCDWLDRGAHAWVLTSSEGIRNLLALASAHFAADAAHGARRMAALLSAPVIVPHPRIAAAAKRAGFVTIVTPGAGDDAIVRAARACAHSSSDFTEFTATHQNDRR